MVASKDERETAGSTASGRLFAKPRLTQGATLVHRDDEQRHVADVAEAVRGVGRHDDHLLALELDHLVAARPAPAALEQQEGLGVRVDVKLDRPGAPRV
jgi:hypothetical protein